jgi:hypothetical protein
MFQKMQRRKSEIPQPAPAIIPNAIASDKNLKKSAEFKLKRKLPDSQLSGRGNKQMKTERTDTD